MVAPGFDSTLYQIAQEIVSKSESEYGARTVGARCVLHLLVYRVQCLRPRYSLILARTFRSDQLHWIQNSVWIVNHPLPAVSHRAGSRLNLTFLNRVESKVVFPSNGGIDRVICDYGGDDSILISIDFPEACCHATLRTVRIGVSFILVS